MTPLATVLYEDSMSGPTFPLHDLVMRIVEDELADRLAVETWRLRKLILANPRNGISKLLQDVKRTGRIAGAGRLFLLVDSDRIAEHLGLAGGASIDAVVAALRAPGACDAPTRLSPYFLHPNVEGLLRAIRACQPALMPRNLDRALAKSIQDRDLVFTAVRKAELTALRECVRDQQPGLDGLGREIAALVERALATPSR